MYKIIMLLGIIVPAIVAYHVYSIIKSEINVKKNGKLVEVKLTYIPLNCPTSVPFKFLYKGKIYEGESKIEICRYFEGDSLQLIHSEDYDDIFLLPNSHPEREIWVPVLFVILSILALISFIKNRNII